MSLYLRNRAVVFDGCKLLARICEGSAQAALSVASHAVAYYDAVELGVNGFGKQFGYLRLQ